MTTIQPYEVSTKLLTDQANVLLRTLATPEGKARAAELRGLDPAEFYQLLQTENAALQVLEAQQESAKAAYLKESGEDQTKAEEGYRWVQRLAAKARSYIASHPEDSADLPGTLRFGKLRVARARGVVYEMRILLPEAERLQPQLAPFGADAAFLAEGRDILAALAAGQQETENAKTHREALTQKVRAGEAKVGGLLKRLVAADEAASLDIPERAPAFRLDAIHAELARQKAERDAGMAAQPVVTG